MALLSAATHFEYLPPRGRSGTPLSYWSSFFLKASVCNPLMFLISDGMQLKALSTLLAGQLCILLISFLVNLLPSTYPFITLDIIFLLLPDQFVFRFRIFCFISFICCQPYIIKYRSRLLSRLYIFSFF